MTLHGQVKSNGQVLMAWSATNQGEEPSGECRYRCRVVFQTAPSVDFDVVHHPDAGAAALAAAVLSEVARGTRT